MLKAILIDDEISALKTLRWALEKYFPDIEIMGAYDNPIEGKEALKKQQPDILFLDIEMPRLNGFDLLDGLETISFNLIFVTAYDQYAVKAFRVNAIDYLLKPIETKALKEAINRVKLKKQYPTTTSEEKKQQIERLKSSFNKIPLNKAEGIEFVFPNQIIYCKSDGSYTTIVLEKRKVVITKSLREMEEVLQKYGFLRVHKSYLINLSHILEYVRHDGGYLKMDNGDKVAVSRRKKDQLMQLF